MSKNKQLFAAVILGVAIVSGQNAWGESLRVYADIASREVYGCSGRLVVETSGQGILVGYPEDFTAYPSCDGLYSQSNALWAFRLPQLPEGKAIKSATFYVYYIQHFDSSGKVRYGPSESLYALPYRAGGISSPINASDHYVGVYGGDSSDCAAIQENFIGDLIIHPVWKSSNATGSERLRSFLQSQYDNGAKEGDWLLLRQNCESIGTNGTTREHFGDSYYMGGQYKPYIEYELEDATAVLKTPELKPGLVKVNAPIQHQSYYLHERELFGYNPRFTINSAQFGPDNRPYIRVETGVMTLDVKGRWITLHFTNKLKEVFPAWDGTWVMWGPGSEDRIVFDDVNDAYLLVTPNGYGYVLMYSRDLCRTWQVCQMVSEVQDVRIEFRDGNNDKSKPPVILARTLRPGGGANYLKIFAPYKNGNGTITIPAGVRVTGISLVGNGLNAGKGASNLTITKGNKTHIVFAGRYFEGADRGTPQYVVTYDHLTGTVSPPIEQSPIYLGSAGDPEAAEPDGHNWPAITIDSYGYLHVILAAHGVMNGECFKYRRSVNPNDATSWTATQNFTPGYTYPSLLCDTSNKLHLIARDYWEPEMRLKYQYKAYGQAWSSRRVLVIPWDARTYYRAPYIHYAAKFALDRNGRMYVCYYNDRNLNIGTDEFNQAQFDAFNAKYPFANGLDDDWHDPSMLTSDDGGASWHLTTTSDFENGIIE